jgi:perosamine synthetase
MKKYDVALAELMTEFVDGKYSGWVTKFEKHFLNYFPGTYAVSFNSATGALHSAMFALGIQPGDEVIQPGLTVVMDSFMTQHLGAVPVFADVDSKTFNICPFDIEAKITERTKAIIIVDWQGLPCDYERIKKISDMYNIPVICDSAQTMHAECYGVVCGNQFDFHIYSFEQKKHFTTGSEGGMLVTTKPNLAEKARKFGGIGYKHLTADAGRTSLSKSMAQDPDYLRFEVRGLNYRMNEISALIGVSQLPRSRDLVEHRIRVAELFKSKLEGLSEITFQESNYPCKHTYYTLGILYEGSRPWKDIYNQYSCSGGKPFYASVAVPYLEYPTRGGSSYLQEFKPGLCPVAEHIQKKVIALKTNYEDLHLAEIDANRLRDVLSA